MKHFIYKTVNLINQRFYVGVHSTEDLGDGYLGSGTILRKAIKKYGKANFKREILHFTETQDQAWYLETILVTEDFLKNPKVYNQALGGSGGSLGVANGMYGKKHSVGAKTKIKNKAMGRVSPQKGTVASQSTKDLMSKKSKARLAIPENNGMYGKKHSVGAKTKMRYAQLGEKSHMFGKRGANCHNYGKVRSQLTKTKMSIAKAGKCTIPLMPGKLNSVDYPDWYRSKEL